MGGVQSIAVELDVFFMRPSLHSESSSHKLLQFSFLELLCLCFSSLVFQGGVGESIEKSVNSEPAFFDHKVSACDIPVALILIIER